MKIKIRNKYIASIVLGAMVFCCSSCSDWFDVNPKSQVKEEALFDNESGFRDALLGVYTLESRDANYGGNGTMGLMDVLGMVYSNASYNSDLYEALEYNYKDEGVQQRINGMWGGLYQGVMNCNYLIKNIREKGDVCSSATRKIIEGEALGMRAYLIFDALRAFAPSYKAGKDKTGVPYVDQVTNSPVEPMTVAKTLDRLVADLENARGLLKDVDPIGPAFKDYSEAASYKTEQYFRDNGFMLYRTSRMNYYGITALLARVCLYKEDMQKAAQYALEVINSGRFYFVNDAIIADETKNSQDTKAIEIIARHEYITGLYVYGLKENRADNYFRSLNGNPNLMITTQKKNEMFESEGLDLDIRCRRLFTTATSYADYITKYSAGTQIPLLKLGEMYLIAAEATGDIKYINDLRRGHGYISDLEEGTTVDDVLADEYLRELFGEGQMFYFYKRQNYDEIPGAYTFDSSYYVLPLPDDEIEFGYGK